MSLRAFAGINCRQGDIQVRSMKRLSTRKTRAEQLSGDAGKSSHKRALTGPRAVATGVVLYTAVRAAFVGSRLIRAEHGSEQAATDTRSRPNGMPARENDLPPSLTLPNRRWSRIAAERR
jgi:hypothetical protein